VVCSGCIVSELVREPGKVLDLLNSASANSLQRGGQEEIIWDSEGRFLKVTVI